MKIIGIDGMTPDQLEFELNRGGKFIIFDYCVSGFIMTIRRSSDVYFIKSDQRRFFKGISYTLVTLLFGWWGIPWGPIYTIISLIVNISGGKDVTDSVVASLQ